MNVTSGIIDQLSLKIATSTLITTTIPKKMILCQNTGVPAEPFLNFIENIGISLTRRSESNSDKAGMNHTDDDRPNRMPSGSQ